MCNILCWEDTRQPVTTLTPLPHGEVYRGNRHHNVCEHVRLYTNQGPAPPPTLGPRALQGTVTLTPRNRAQAWDPCRVSRKRWARLLM
jgi:hypothetical protein